MNIVLDSSVEEKAPDHIEANEAEKSKEEVVSYLRSIFIARVDNIVLICLGISANVYVNLLC